MSFYDPATELEITRRTIEAMAREARHPRIELHRRVIEARNQARSLSAEDLLRRISDTLTAA